MNPRENIRSKMVDGAVTLLATEGVEGTTFADVLAVSDAPRGSVYHHFPGGKPELMHAALDRACERSLAAMEEFRGQPADEVLERFLARWRGILDRSRVSAGCAVLAVTVAGPAADLLDSAGKIFHSWTERLTELFVDGGLPGPAAKRLSIVLIAATEGAIVLSRAQRSIGPFDETANMLLDLARGMT